MKKVYIILLLTLVAICSMQAQVHVENAQRITQLQESLTLVEAVSVAQDWVASIPVDQLLDCASQTQKILYPPYSTIKGRMTYRILLERLLQEGGDELTLLRYKYMYESLCYNNEGDVASDFVYYDINDNEQTLQSHRGKKTLIIFNDPECEECAALRHHIVAEQELQGVAIDSTTTVLVIYPDEPTEEWREAVAHYPATWIVGYSADVSDVYDLRTLPSTYLLDEKHIILLRNAHTYITTKL